MKTLFSTSPNCPFPDAALFPSGVRILFAFLGIFVTVSALPLFSQSATKSNGNEIFIRGIVLDKTGASVRDAKVNLEGLSTQLEEEKLTDGQGAFTMSVREAGSYLVTAEKLGRHSEPQTLAVESTHVAPQMKLVLSQVGPSAFATQKSKSSPSEAMQFVDQPVFTVSGVTDFTAAGGHGSDSSLRTSEALARETSNLKPNHSAAVPQTDPSKGESENELRATLVKAPNSFQANRNLGEFYLHGGRYAEAVPLLKSAYQIDKSNHQNEYDLALACKGLGDLAHSRQYVQELLSSQQSGDVFRLAGDLDESLDDSLAAVREYQKAVTLDPSEQNFFSWGSELLVHRAIWQAQQVFEQGVKNYPASSRMLTGLGTALFAGAAYSEAATRLCQASDLDPVDQEPYLFLGKVQSAAPYRQACIEPRLQRFVQDQPGSAAANYLYAMAIQNQTADVSAVDANQKSEEFLRKAILIDYKYAEAYLQLGILQAARKDYNKAIASYKQAIAADPRLSDAYYRLAVAYNRTGQATKAKEEFQLHDEVAKQQAAEVERQRQEVKQFRVVLAPDRAHLLTP